MQPSNSILKHCSYQTGYGDFAITPYVNCDINVDALRALSFIDIVGSTICNLLLLRYFIVRSMAKKRLFFLSTDPRSVFPLFFLLHGIGDFIYAVIKVSYEEPPIVGKDLSVTFLAVLLPFFCFCGLVLYYYVIINFLKGYSRMMSAESREKVEKRFASLKKISRAIPPISAIPCILPLVSLGYPQYGEIFAATYLIGNGILAMFYGLLFNFALGFLLTELHGHLEVDNGSGSDDIQQIYRRLRIAYCIGSVLFFIIGFSYMIFGSYEVLLRKSSYLILVIQITVHPTFTVLILTVSRISHKYSKTSPMRIRSSLDEIQKSNEEMKIDALGGSVSDA